MKTQTIRPAAFLPSAFLAVAAALIGLTGTLRGIDADQLGAVWRLKALHPIAIDQHVAYIADGRITFGPGSLSCKLPNADLGRVATTVYTFTVPDQALVVGREYTWNLKAASDETEAAPGWPNVIKTSVRIGIYDKNSNVLGATKIVTKMLKTGESPADYAISDDLKYKFPPPAGGEFHFIVSLSSVGGGYRYSYVHDPNATAPPLPPGQQLPPLPGPPGPGLAQHDKPLKVTVPRYFYERIMSAGMWANFHVDPGGVVNSFTARRTVGLQPDGIPITNIPGQLREDDPARMVFGATTPDPSDPRRPFMEQLIPPVIVPPDAAGLETAFQALSRQIYGFRDAASRATTQAAHNAALASMEDAQRRLAIINAVHLHRDLEQNESYPVWRRRGTK